MRSTELQLMVTLWPSFPHFERFAHTWDIAGIRLNSAMMHTHELETELEIVGDRWRDSSTRPLYFDVKGRQPRVVEVIENDDQYLDLRLNHSVDFSLADPSGRPTGVLFKAGGDLAIIDRIEEDGRRLIFRKGYGPRYVVNPGESVCVKADDFRILDGTFSAHELEKIRMVRDAGCKRWFLSYVESQDDVDQLLALVGEDAEIMLKIENKAGLRYVREEFDKSRNPNLRLVAACGDLYIELDSPVDTLFSLREIIAADPDAIAGSRMMLSVMKDRHKERDEELRDEYKEADLCDFAHLAWLYDAGYRTMMLCDEICLDETLLARGVHAFRFFARDYSAHRHVVQLHAELAPCSEEHEDPLATYLFPTSEEIESSTSLLPPPPEGFWTKAQRFLGLK